MHYQSLPHPPSWMPRLLVKQPPLRHRVCPFLRFLPHRFSPRVVPGRPLLTVKFNVQFHKIYQHNLIVHGNTIPNGRKIARNVMAMATGEALATREAPVELAVAPTELPEFVKTLQETWDKVEDKYAVSTLAVSGLVTVVGSAGLVSAIDRLPLVPGFLEAVGIGYSGYFAYKYLLFKPDRDAMLKKVKETYKEILGIS